MEKIGWKDYARLALKHKRITPTVEHISLMSKIIERSFTTSYSAIAADIDGTLTERGGDKCPESLAKILAEKLDEGIYIILLTGSSDKHVKKIIDLIKSNCKKTPQSYSRLWVVVYSGKELIRHRRDGTITKESLLDPDTDSIDYLHKIKSELTDKLKNYSDEIEDIRLRPEDNPCGLRIVTKEELLPGKVEEIWRIIDSYYHEKKDSMARFRISPMRATWRDKQVFELTSADKDWALSYLYIENDLIDTTFLRIGDQGNIEGNDFNLLDSASGFSVGELSEVITRCFPVINLENGNTLKGSEATEYLIKTIKFSPKLTIPPIQVKEARNEYEQVITKLNKDAQIASNEIFREFINSISNMFISKDKDQVEKYDDLKFLFDDVFGSIKITQEELKKVTDLDLWNFFNVTGDWKTKSKGKGYERILYHNNDIILRGPKYYIGLSYDPEEKIGILIKDQLVLLDKISKDYEWPDTKKSIIQWKLELALADYLRNNLLLSYTMLVEASVITTSSQLYWKKLLRKYEKLLSSAIKFYYSLLKGDMSQVRNSILEIRDHKSAHYEFSYRIDALSKYLIEHGLQAGKVIRKWREVDHPGEIFLSLKYASQTIGKNNLDNFPCAVGLMYGGLELPYVWKHIICGSSEINVAIMSGASLYRYGGDKVSTDVFSKELLSHNLPNLEDIDNVIRPNTKALIFDDNVLTGRTLELAWKRLAALSVEVPYFICVRYPCVGRIPQMEMKRHGGIQPESLGERIIGLVSKSAYSTIPHGQDRGDYKDKKGRFDINRLTVEEILENNGKKGGDKCQKDRNQSL